MSKLNRNKIIKAIKDDSHGNISLIARKCEVTYKSVRDFLKKPEHSDLMDWITLLREEIDSSAESNINKLITRGIQNDFYKDKLTYEASKFQLTTEGLRKRRVITKHEINHTGTITHKFEGMSDQQRIEMKNRYIEMVKNNTIKSELLPVEMIEAPAPDQNDNKIIDVDYKEVE